jgi:hypothetical protein
MDNFAGSPAWKLVNDFTIHENQKLGSGRHFMRACVPKVLDIEVKSFEVIQFIEWPPSWGEQSRPEAYADRSYIKFNGDLDDKIIVFTMEGGEIGTFRTLTDATIRSIPAGQIGGIHKATVFDGIGYSGMASDEVPEKGLMEGEPGALSFIAANEEHHRSGEKTSPFLTATLFLDDDRFSRLLSTLLLGSKPVGTFKLQVLAELFESEVSASLSEPWMSRDYGLLMKGDVGANKRARIESIAISTGATKLQTDNAAFGQGSGLDRMLGIDDHRATEIAAPYNSRAHLSYQRYIFIALVVLILVTLLSN